MSKGDVNPDHCEALGRCPVNLDIRVTKIEDKLNGRFGIETVLEEVREDVKSLLRLSWGILAVPTLLGVAYCVIQIVRATNGGT